MRPNRPATGRHAWPRWTVRLRLTLWYGGLFVLAGLVLVATSYLLLGQRLGPSTSGGVAAVLCSSSPTSSCARSGAAARRRRPA